MKKIFIDVGGYEGDASLAALDPIFAFDEVYCFEPVKSCAEHIRKRISDPKFEAIPAALADYEGQAQLFGPGTVAGSLFSDHQHVDNSSAEYCRVIRASDFIRPFTEKGDEVYVKLNCEGAEVPIVHDLLLSGTFMKLKSVLLDLDARKIPSLAVRLGFIESELAKIKDRNWYYPEEVQYGQQCTYGGIRNWLFVAGAGASGLSKKLGSLGYNVTLWNKREFRGYYKFLLARKLPSGLMNFYYRHVRPRIYGRESKALAGHEDGK